MNRQECEQAIDDEVCEMGFRGQLMQVTIDKIMLIVDEYAKPDAKPDANKPLDQLEEIARKIMEPSPIVTQLVERQKWNLDVLKEEATNFVFLNYPTGGDFFQIRKHFFNSIKLRKPNDKLAKESRFDKFNNAHKSQFGSTDDQSS